MTGASSAWTALPGQRPRAHLAPRPSPGGETCASTYRARCDSAPIRRRRASCQMRHGRPWPPASRPAAGEIDEVDDARRLLRCSAASLDSLTYWLMALDVEFQVLEPAALIERLRVAGERLAAAAGAQRLNRLDRLAAFGFGARHLPMSSATFFSTSCSTGDMASNFCLKCPAKPRPNRASCLAGHAGEFHEFPFCVRRRRPDRARHAARECRRRAQLRILERRAERSARNAATHGRGRDPRVGQHSQSIHASHDDPCAEFGKDEARCRCGGPQTAGERTRSLAR